MSVTAEQWRVVRPTGSTVQICKSADDAADLVSAKEKLKYRSVHEPSRPLKARLDYAVILAEEILTSVTDEDDFSGGFWMERGKELEDKARKWYEYDRNVDVDQVGLIYLNEDRRVGVSLDGLIGDDGTLEVKCLNRVNHLHNIMAEDLDPDYVDQVQGGLNVTDRAWCDVLFYHPDSSIEGFVKRIHRDEDYIEQQRIQIESFITEVDQAVDRLTQLAEAA